MLSKKKTVITYVSWTITIVVWRIFYGRWIFVDKKKKKTLENLLNFFRLYVDDFAMDHNEEVILNIVYQLLNKSFYTIM